MTQITRERSGWWASGAVALLLAAGIGPAAVAQPGVAPTALAPLPGHTGSDAFGVNDPDVNIVILGGAGVVSETVETALGGFTGGDVERLWGPNRFATAAAISAATFSPGVPAVYITTGLNFPDALAGGPAAAACGCPILLVLTDSIPAPTTTELTRLVP